ncbi:MAG: DUF6323 family protein [Lawsonibacter sp.]|nr:DUF6323 family protein [Lawsonibacter sp.]
MNHSFDLTPLSLQKKQTEAALVQCNQLTQKVGLLLSDTQIQTLAEQRIQALAHTERIEFGPGILQPLIYCFYDSPYLTQANYEETIVELQTLFYTLKNETKDRLSDDELLGVMKTIFDGKAQGSVEYLSGVPVSNLLQIASDLAAGSDWRPEEEEAEEDLDE